MNFTKSKVINRLALVLISIMVLELVLIGDQVQPVKAIKKKMLVKKLKKLLPLLALVKPKKKIILLPIPIPMFSKDHGGYPTGQHRPLAGFGGQPHLRPHHHRHQNPNGQVPPVATGLGQPMSFMMMAEPGLVPNTMSVNMLDVGPTASAGDPYGGGSGGGGLDNEPMMSMVMPPPLSPSGSSAPMMMPSMTMTIQSEPGGGSNIELSTNIGQSSTPTQNQSSALVRPRANYKWRPQQLQVQQQQISEQYHEEQYSTGGDQYYSSPWVSARPPSLASPAKLFRAYNQQPAGQPTSRRPQSVQHSPPPPPPPTSSQTPRAQLELEDFVAAGPPQLMPVYQTPNGQLHMTPPREQEDLGPNSDEVQTIGEHQATPKPVIQQQQRPSAPIKSSGRLVSPAAKGKQQQQQQLKTAY